MPKPDPQLLEADRYPARFEISTRFQDLDPNAHINNVATAALFEDARVRFDWGIGLREIMAAHGRKAMIASLAVEYLGEMFYPAPIVAYVGSLGARRTSWGIASILTQEGRVAAFMRSTMVCVADGRPASIPESFLEEMRKSLIRLDEPVA
jgi:acyl-CoA thioester hydrolase